MRFVIFLTLFSLSLVADESKFDEANQLYEQGDFESSISKYHSLLESGAQTSAVHSIWVMPIFDKTIQAWPSTTT